jgi:hypothetical protein
MSPAADKLSLLLRHVALPALAPLALVGLYLTPLAVVGCAERGLLALAVTATAAVSAFGCIVMAFRARARGDERSSWWMLSTAILALSLALLLGPLG